MGSDWQMKIIKIHPKAGNQTHYDAPARNPLAGCKATHPHGRCTNSCGIQHPTWRPSQKSHNQHTLGSSKGGWMCIYAREAAMRLETQVPGEMNYTPLAPSVSATADSSHPTSD